MMVCVQVVWHTKQKILYRPLPDYLTIQPSKIDGLGLFTLVDIDKGVNLGMSHIIDALTLDTIRTPLGGFVNHSDTPNLKKALDHRKYYLYTIVDVPMGSELTLKYEWYEVEGGNNDNER